MVVDATSGSVIYRGSTSLRLAPAYPAIHQAGNYAVALDMHRGVHGIGSRAEPTWFVPGNGSLDQFGRDDLWHSDVASQSVGGPGSDTRVVFSLLNGRILSPPAHSGRRQLRAVVYPQGFAIEEGVDEGRVTRPDEIRFFDLDGRELGAVTTSSPLVTQSAYIPMTQAAGTKATVYTRDGGTIARVPRRGDAVVELIGTRLFVDDSTSSSFPEWNQFDLAAAGVQGETCTFGVSDRLGSDGRVLVLDVWNPDADAVAKGVDPTSCSTLWRIPARPGSYAQVVRVNTTLVQLSDDATELMSLTAPE